MIKNVLYSRAFSGTDTVFRIFLFKLFNKIETWRLLEQEHGELIIGKFDITRFGRTLDAAFSAGARLYSAAYIMPSGPAEVRQPRKHRMHLQMLERMFDQGLPERILAAKTMAELYGLLLGLPGIGPFLAYQFATDLNYSKHLDFSEMEFVVPGPGARDGLRKCFKDLGDYSEAETIRWVAERQEQELRERGLKFRTLWGRSLQLIDCQNLFCEVDKYARVRHPEFTGVSGRTRIKQKFAPNLSAVELWFPPKWGINHQIEVSNQSAKGPSLL